MVVLANPSRDRHEALTWQLRRRWYFSWPASNETGSIPQRLVPLQPLTKFAEIR